MFLKHSVTSSVYRLYENGEDSYENREDYIGITSVIWISDTEVYIYGAVVSNNKGGIGFLMILNDLINNGVKLVKIARAGKRKLPFGKLSYNKLNESVWEIDLTDQQTINRIRKINGKL